MSQEVTVRVTIRANTCVAASIPKGGEGSVHSFSHQYFEHPQHIQLFSICCGGLHLKKTSDTYLNLKDLTIKLNKIDITLINKKKYELLCNSHVNKFHKMI